MFSTGKVFLTCVLLQATWMLCDGQAVVTCRVDVAILIDQSGSIFDNGGVQAWYNMTNFTQAIIDQFATTEVDSHISLIKFGHLATNYTNGLIASKAEMNAALLNLRTYTEGERTNTSAALYMANLLFDKKGTAQGGDRSDVPDVVILVTDGVPTNGFNGRTDNTPANAQIIKDEVLSQAKILKDKGILVITVGVTDKTDPDLLNRTASSPENYIAVMDFSTLAAELNSVIQTTCRSITPPPDCRQNADVYFVLDSSGSIDENEFKDVRQFVANMMLRIPIGSGSKAGVLYWSNNMFMGFNLNQHDTMEKAYNATLLIPYMRSTTNTASVLSYLRQTAFTQAQGDQANVPNIAVVFTDGNSNVNRQNTLNEAYLAKQQGIHIITIGITNWFNQYELQGIASDPISANYMHYNQTSTLTANKVAENKLKALLCNDVNECSSVTCQCSGTCIDKIGSFTCRCPGTCAGVLCERNCRNRMDVVFAVDASGSMQDFHFRSSLNFVRSVIFGLNINSGDRVGFVRFADNPFQLFQLKDYTTLDGVLNALTVAFSGGTTNTFSAIDAVRQTMFTTGNGDTSANTNILVIITDGRSQSFSQTWTAARLARQAGATVIVVGVGSNVFDKELQAMASGVGAVNVFKASNFASMTGLVTSVTDATCNNVGECESVVCQRSSTPVDQIGSCTCNCIAPSNSNIGSSGRFCERLGSGKVDIVFVIDSSGSIRGDRLKQILQFLGEIVRNYPVGSQLARFGAIYFSDTATKAFDLNTYTLAEDIITHLNEIPFVGQTTNIADAIALARTSSFTAANGDRSDARNVLFIITDGASNINSLRTVPEAIAFRETGGQAGASIVVLGIGTLANTLELRGMASRPYSKMLHYANSFNDVTTITATRTNLINALTLSASDGVNQCDANPCRAGTCTDDLHTYTCECPQRVAGINCSTTCNAQLDLALVLDFSGSMDSVLNNVIEFARLIVYGLDAPRNVRVAVIDYDSNARVHFNLLNYTSTRQEILNGISFTNHGSGTNTVAALGLLNSAVFTATGGDRSGVKNVALVVTDGGSNIGNLQPAVAAVRAANIELFVAGFGAIQMNEIDAIASPPANTHKVTISATNTVQQAANQMISLLCQL